MLKSIITVIFVSTTYFLTSQSLTQYVNPFIGTSNYGATHPGPVMPNGLASVVPFNVAFKKDGANKFEKDEAWNSRVYIKENQFLTGFSHVNLSGVGCPELGSILLMPTSGELELDPEQYGSTYRNESASPGYYSSTLTKYDVKVETSATLRTGVSKYHFSKGKNHILLNLGLALSNESGAYLKIVAPNKVEGYRMIGTFCYNSEDVRPVYFAMEASEEADEFGAFKKMPKMGAEKNWTKYSDAYKAYPGYTLEMIGDNIGSYFTYNLAEDKVITVKVGISYTSIENAWENLKEEQQNQTFNEIVGKSRLTWENLLSKIEVKTESKDDKVIFYTALYHILLHPNILQDVNGDFPKMGGYETSNSGDKNRYTVFSLWDTYRNVHPFLTLVYPDLQLDMVNSMLDMSKETGWLPKWELLSMETGVMVGDPAIPVIADTYLKGLKKFDFDYAYEIARKGATTQENNPLRPGIKDYINLGFIPEGGDHGVWGTVSTNLEYNISDWNLSKMAGIKGNLLDQSMFFDRSMNYKNYFDRRTKMLRPRNSDRSWLDPFNPEAGKNFEAVVGFVEGNAWQYRFYVPHDIPGMIKLLGGEESFVIALNRCFSTNNYDMANEPDITYAFLYNHVKGEEWRSQEKVPELIRTYYKNAPDGIPGNDDTGTLSAWLAFSSMGLYPHCPGDTEYTITPPIFDEIIIHLDQEYYPGSEIKITKVSGRDNTHIRKIKWNGNNYDRYFIDHNLLVQGGELKIIMK